MIRELPFLQDLTTYDESTLLERVAGGDESAFAKLFELHHQHLGRHIFQIVKSRELTEEIVQDTFIKIWETRESLTEIRNFSIYLFVISRNQAITAFRRLVRERKFSGALYNVDEEEDVTVYHEREFREKGLSLIEEAVDQLPEQQRKCFILSRREKLTYEQIGERLGIGKESVKTHISLAVASITKFVKAKMDRALVMLWIAGNFFK